MRLAFPRSLQGQAVVVLLVGLVASHAIGLLIYAWDRGETVASTEALDVNDRVFGVVSLLEKLPPEWRDDIVRAANTRTLAVFLSPAAATIRDQSDGFADKIAQDLRDDLRGWDSGRIVVALNQGVSFPRDRGPFGQFSSGSSPANATVRANRQQDVVNISVRLDDGEWLNFVGIVPKATLLWPGAVMAYVLTTAAGVLVLAVWFVRRVTAPLTSFARAAEELGKNLRTDPLAETGPTEVRQASHALNEMQARLRRLVENRTQMLAAISHDLRTPLTLIRLRVEVLGGEQAQHLIRALDELNSLIGSILEFAGETFEDEPARVVDLDALVGSLCDDLADAGARIEYASTGPLPYMCRRIALRRALSNLIDNAVKYGGQARIHLAASRATVTVAVDDDGPGIPDGELSQVFMPFYRLEQSRSRNTGGSGLGLSIAQAIVHGHGGVIQLQNREEGGLRAVILLPA